MVHRSLGARLFCDGAFLVPKSPVQRNGSGATVTRKLIWSLILQTISLKGLGWFSLAVDTEMLARKARGFQGSSKFKVLEDCMVAYI